MLSTIELVFVTVLGVFLVEIPVVVLLTPRLVVWWIRRNAGAILRDMLADESVKEIINEMVRKFMGHIFGQSGGRPMKTGNLIQSIIGQVAMGWLEKSKLIPGGIPEAAKTLVEIPK